MFKLSRVIFKKILFSGGGEIIKSDGMIGRGKGERQEKPQRKWMSHNVFNFSRDINVL